MRFILQVRDGQRLNKGVKLLLWYNSNGYANDAPQTPRHCMNTVVEHRFHAVAEPEVGIPAINRVCAGVEHDLILYSLDGRELRRCRSDRMPLDGLPRGIYLLAVDGVVYRIYKN